jgi:hypothetical protein
MSREVRDLIGKPPAIAQVGPEILRLSEIVIVIVDIKAERLPARTRGADPYQVRSSPMPVADEISDSVPPASPFCRLQGVSAGPQPSGYLQERALVPGILWGVLLIVGNFVHNSLRLRNGLDWQPTNKHVGQDVSTAHQDKPVIGRGFAQEVHLNDLGGHIVARACLEIILVVLSRIANQEHVGGGWTAPCVIRVRQKTADGPGMKDAVVELVVDIPDFDGDYPESPGAPMGGQCFGTGMEILMRDDDIVGPMVGRSSG